MKKLFVAFLPVLFIISCTESIVQEAGNVTPEKKEISSDTIADKVVFAPDSVEISEEILVNQWTGFMGNFFAVKYPDEFTASPLTPVSKLNDIETVDTDEAYFYAPDSSVVFFVYSPQWSGAPENYLEKRSNEKQVDQDKKEMRNGDLLTTIESASFTDITNAYQRAYVSIREGYDGDVETIKVFGIQYKNQAAYDKYRPAYKAFKKSLQQFAD